MGFLWAALRALAGKDDSALSRDVASELVRALIHAESMKLVELVARPGSPRALAEEAWAVLEQAGFEPDAALIAAGGDPARVGANEIAIVNAIVDQLAWRDVCDPVAQAPPGAGAHGCRFDPLFQLAGRMQPTASARRNLRVVRLLRDCTCGCGRRAADPLGAGLAVGYQHRLDSELLRAVKQAVRFATPVLLDAARACWRRMDDPLLREALVRYLRILTRRP